MQHSVTFWSQDPFLLQTMSEDPRSFGLSGLYQLISTLEIQTKTFIKYFIHFEK